MVHSVCRPYAITTESMRQVLKLRPILENFSTPDESGTAKITVFTYRLDAVIKHMRFAIWENGKLSDSFGGRDYPLRTSNLHAWHARDGARETIRKAIVPKFSGRHK